MTRRITTTLGITIAAAVDHGRVTLSGTVATRRAKLATEQLANNTVGVISVVDLIEVVPPEVESEAVLAQRVKDAMRLNPITEAPEIRATASGSEVTSTGTVDSFYEKAEISDVAQGVSGVATVKNLVSVANAYQAGAIQVDIQLKVDPS